MNKARWRAAGLAAAMCAIAIVSTVIRPSTSSDHALERTRLERLFPTQVRGWRQSASNEDFVCAEYFREQAPSVYEQRFSRTYVNSLGRRVTLVVVYVSDRPVTLQLDRPEVCHRAAGYAGALEIKRGWIELAGARIHVNRLVVRRLGQAEAITYWSVLGGEATEDAGNLAWRRIGLFFARGPTDGMLICLSSMEVDGAQAFARHDEFANALILALPAFDRSRVTGASPSVARKLGL